MRLLAISILLVACGDDGGGSVPVTTDTARAPCEQFCARQDRCGRGEAGCVDECVNNVGGGWAREDGWQHVGDCVETLACEIDDDACAAEIPALAVHERWDEACRQQEAMCSGFGLIARCSIDEGGFPWFRLVMPSIMEQFISCLDLATCEERSQCVLGVFSEHDIDL